MKRKVQIKNLLEFVYSEICAYGDWLGPQERQNVGEPDLWSRRDVLAHLAEEHRWVAERLAAGPGAVFTGRGEDFEQINRDIWFAYKHKSFDQIMLVLQGAQQSLLQTLEMISDDDLELQGSFPWTGERPLWRYLVGILGMHSISHLCQQYAENMAPASARRLSDEVSAKIIAVDPVLGPTVSYNQACISALIGDQAVALGQLREALTLNPGLIDWAQQDSDLASLHGTPEFASLLLELQGQ